MGNETLEEEKPSFMDYLFGVCVSVVMVLVTVWVCEFLVLKIFYPESTPKGWSRSNTIINDANGATSVMCRNDSCVLYQGGETYEYQL